MEKNVPQTNMKSESFFSFVAGAAIGVTLGVLFAPDKGEVTRRKIKDAAQEGYDTAKEKVTEAYAEAKVRARKVRKDLNDLKSILKDEGEDMKEEARAKILDQLDRLERALSKEDGVIIDDQFEDA